MSRSEKAILFLHARQSSARRTALLLVSCGVLLASGCSTRKRPAIAWKTAIQVKPNLPAARSPLGDLDAGSAPDLRMTIPTPPSRLANARNVPARPRVTAPPTTNTDSTDKANSLLLVPQLTPEESSAAQQQANQSLEVADRNLAAANGKQLNATQTDLASKTRGFVTDARAASKIGDWRRAKALAKKAEVISQELADSF